MAKEKNKKDLNTPKTEEKEKEVVEPVEAAPPPAESEEIKAAPEKDETPEPDTQAAPSFKPETRTDIPELKSGDAIQVLYRVIEGGKERLQTFEGTVIAMNNSGITRTITVRKYSFGIGVERIFPINSPLVHKVVIKKHSRVRRSKLYYLRQLKGKAARLKELR